MYTKGIGVSDGFPLHTLSIFLTECFSYLDRVMKLDELRTTWAMKPHGRSKKCPTLRVRNDG